MSAIT